MGIIELLEESSGNHEPPLFLSMKTHREMFDSVDFLVIMTFRRTFIISVSGKQ